MRKEGRCSTMADGGQIPTVTKALLDQARGGEAEAVCDVVAAIQACAAEAYRHLPHDPVLALDEVRERYIEAAVRLVCGSELSLVAGWQQELHGSFEEHVAVIILDYFEALASPKGTFGADPQDLSWSFWTPELVTMALEHGGPLGRQLEDLVIRAVLCVVKRVARRARGLRGAVGIDDLNNELVKQLYEVRGPRRGPHPSPAAQGTRGHMLRQWRPNRGLGLEAFTKFIAQKYAWKVLGRDAKRVGLPLNEPDGLPIGVDQRLSDNMERYLRFDRVRRSLSAVDRTIFDGKFRGRKAKEIAAELGMSVNNVNVRWNRLLRRCSDDDEG